MSALRRTRTPPPGSRATAGRLLADASGRTRPGTPAARRSPHRSSATGHPRCRVLRPGWRGPAGSGLRSRGRPVRGSGSTDAPLRPPRQVRPPPSWRRQPATRGCWPGERKKRKGRTGGPTRACLTAGSAPRCQRGLSWAGWPRVPPHYPLTREIRFSGSFFTRYRGIGSSEIGTPVTEPAGEIRRNAAKRRRRFREDRYMPGTSER